MGPLRDLIRSTYDRITTPSQSKRRSSHTTRPCLICCNLDWRTDARPPKAWRSSQSERGFGIRFSGVEALDNLLGNVNCTSCRAIGAIVEHVWCTISKMQRLYFTECMITLSPDQSPRITLSTERFVDIELYIPDGTSPDQPDPSATVQRAWLENLSTRPEISPSPKSPETFSFIENCIQTCLRDHVACHQDNSESSPRVMPRRLLRICGKDFENVHLVELDDVSSRTIKYIALSYCWGPGKEFFRTLKSNIDELKQPFARQRLPVALDEAVQITTRLGLSYIWIDALCIIQDNDLDWELESVKMAAIYENSYLTIAAATSDSVYTSFFNDALRPGAVKQAEWGGHEGLTLRISAAAANNNTRQRLFSQKSSSVPLTARVVPSSGHHSDDDVEPWSKRGWTFQEAVLPTRLVSFTTDELQWSCKTTKACECQAEESRRQLRLPWQTRKSEGEDRKSSEAIMVEKGDNNGDNTQLLYKQGNDAELAIFWEDMIQRYSRRQFTFYKDRLVAIAGIASVLQALDPSRQYLAGLWSSNLIAEMCWSFAIDKARENPSEPSLECYVPTFSWASVKVPVMFRENNDAPWSGPPNPGENFQPAAEVINIHIEASERMPLGQFNQVKVALRGVLIPCVMTRTDTWDEMWDKPGWRQEYTLDFQRGNRPKFFFVDVEMEPGVLEDVDNEDKTKPSEKIAIRAKPILCSSAAEATPRQTDSMPEDGTKRGPIRQDLGGAFVFHMGCTVHSSIPKGQGKLAHKNGAKLKCHFLVLGKSLRNPGCYERLGYWGIDFAGGHDHDDLGPELDNVDNKVDVSIT